MTDAEWEGLLQELDAHRQHVEAWEADAPNPDAARCVQSRHRTLAHLRACQETWFAACLAFVNKPGASLKLPHPWRLFDQQSYAHVSWDEHRRAFLADRQQLLELLRTCDRATGGKVNGNPYTIESLIAGRVAAHERHHLFKPR